MIVLAGERLRLTLSGAGSRAVVSVNAFAVTEPAFADRDPVEDGFTFDVTGWLHVGRNTLSVVLIGAGGAVPFRMTVFQDEQPSLTLDEAEFLPQVLPWRLWTATIELVGARPWQAAALRTGDRTSC